MSQLIAKMVGGIVVEKGELFEKYTKNDGFALSFHAKNGCKHCHERGWQHYTMADGSVEVRTCRCIDKRIDKSGSSSSSLIYKVIRPGEESKFYFNSRTKQFKEVRKSA